jgi:hypothetical protein
MSERFLLEGLLKHARPDLTPGEVDVLEAMNDLTNPTIAAIHATSQMKLAERHIEEAKRIVQRMPGHEVEAKALAKVLELFGAIRKILKLANPVGPQP